MTTPAAGLYPSLAQRIASDPAKLGIATFLQVTPIIAAYTPAVDLAIGALTLGTGTLAPIASTLVPSVGIDPLTQQYKILINPPAGGWKWNYDGVTPPPSVNIFGYAITDAATGLVLMGVTDRLNTPLTLNSAVLLIEDEVSFLMIVPPLQ